MPSRRSSTGSLDLRLVVLVVLALAPAVYWPLRHLLVGRVRRLVFGTRDDPYDVVAGLASRLESEGDAAGQLAAVADAVARAFGVSYVRVEVDRPDGAPLVATHGTAPSSTRTLPIAFRDTTVGRIMLPREGIRARLSRRDEALLSDLVRQAAIAARTERLADELQDIRQRLVLTREEERRRIRRDLHDGLGPALSGVVFRIESARLLVPTDPAAADRALEVGRDQLRDVIADVRRLVHDLRPPALDDLGLLGALRQQADGLSSPGFGVHVAADSVGDLPAAVEVAAYRVVGEAVTNAARHARATRCDVRLTVDDRALRVEVADDGVGVTPTAVAGVGLVSLRERVGRAGRSQRGRVSPVGWHHRPRLATPEEGLMTDPTTRPHDGPGAAGAVRVVLADDHQIMRDGLVALLEALPGLEVVGTAGDGAEAVRVCGPTRPDVVVMDIQMPVVDGIEATRQVVTRTPGRPW